MISIQTKKKWVIRIKYCKEKRSKMNDWECDFIRSMDLRWNYYKIELSLRQSFKLNKLFYKLESEDI